MNWLINPYRKPRLWAERWIGSNASYYSMLTGTLVIGLGIIWMMTALYMGSRPMTWQSLLILSVLVAFGAIRMPLLYLMVVRRLVLEGRTENDRSDVSHR